MALVNVGGQCSALERFGGVLKNKVKEQILRLTVKMNSAGNMWTRYPKFLGNVEKRIVSHCV